MKFKTQETRDKNNVIKLYKWGKNPDNFGLISCSGYLILPLSGPLCPPPADLLSLPPAARMYHLQRSLFGVWPKPKFICREVSVDDTAQQSRDAAGTNHLQTTLFRRTAAGSHRPGSGKHCNSRGGVSSRAEKNKQKRKVKKKKITSFKSFFGICWRSAAKCCRSADTRLSLGILIMVLRCL